METRGSSCERADATGDWIAAGSRASAATPWLFSAFLHEALGTPRPPGPAARAAGRSPVERAAAWYCERGVNGLLAVLGVVLR